MARKAVVDAVTARLGAYDPVDLPLIEMNTDTLAPADASAFMAVQFLASTAARMTTWPKIYQEEGLFSVVISTKNEGGTGEALTIADEIAALFRHQDFGGVRCQVPSSPRLDDENDRGNYFVASVIVPYTHQWQD